MLQTGAHSEDSDQPAILRIRNRTFTRRILDCQECIFFLRTTYCVDAQTDLSIYRAFMSKGTFEKVGGGGGGCGGGGVVSACPFARHAVLCIAEL